MLICDFCIKKNGICYTFKRHEETIQRIRNEGERSDALELNQPWFIYWYLLFLWFS